MAKVSFSFITCLFLYMALFAHPSTSTVNCPPRLCGRKGMSTLTDHHITRGGDDDDDCKLRPPSLCWRKQQVDFLKSVTSPLASICASIKSQLPQAKEADVSSALTSCLGYYADALRTLPSVKDKLQGGERVDWISIAMSVYGDITSCQQALSGVGNGITTGVDFSGAGDVLDVLRKIILGS